MDHELTFVVLCAPVLFADNARCRFSTVMRYGFPVAVVVARLLSLLPIFSVVIAETLLVLSFIYIVV